MAVLTVSNLKKAYYYFKKNGLKAAWYAAAERIGNHDTEYTRRTPSQEELDRMRGRIWKHPFKISILVPAYETNPVFFRQMVDSVIAQAYQNWELIIADASPSDKLKCEMEYCKDSRIRYLKLKENRGISCNTNEALAEATGDYVGLLDHDDVLEPHALYVMMNALERAETVIGKFPAMLYSDEDKCDNEMKHFYEPHHKEKFNLDLFLSNNYICHFTMMEMSLMKRLGFRREYDGAQDYDIFLRAVDALWEETDRIVHVPEILYHWRCHAGSTAENPQSKMYAYEAGRRALEDFCSNRGWSANVSHTNHLGFYRVEYEGDIFKQRKDLAAVAGRILKRGRIAGGAYREDGSILYEGLPQYYSGYMNRAVLTQDVAAADFRCISVNPQFDSLWKDISHRETDPVRAALLFGKVVAGKGCRILWDPFWQPENGKSGNGRWHRRQ